MKIDYLWLGCKAKEKSSGKIGRVVSEANPNDTRLVASRMVYSVAFGNEGEVRRLNRSQLEFMPE